MYGLGVHIIMGGNARRMVLFVVTSWLGFLLGQYVGDYLQIALFRIGVVHFLPASVCAAVLLLFAHVLTSQSINPVSRR